MRRKRTKHQERNQEHADYVRWLHTQPCAACGYRGKAIQAAHVGRGGTGMKHGSDAEAIPLCGPRLIRSLDGWHSTFDGCHAAHDQLCGEFRLFTREMLQLWNESQVAAHRGRYEASLAEPRIGAVPF